MGLFGRSKDENLVDIYSGDAFRNYKRFLHIYVVNDEQCFIKLNSFDADENKSLFDAPIIKEIAINKKYFDVFLDEYKYYTGEKFRQVRDGENEVSDPKVVVDSIKKTLTYILVIKDSKPIDMSRLPQVKFVYDWLSVSDFLETISSNKFVNYGKEYTDFVVRAICELFDIEDSLKEQKYTSNRDF